VRRVGEQFVSSPELSLHFWQRANNVTVSLNLQSANGDWRAVADLFQAKEIPVPLAYRGRGCAIGTTALLGEADVFDCTTQVDELKLSTQQMLEWRGGSIASLFGLDLINWRPRHQAPRGNARAECGSPVRSASGVVPPVEPSAAIARVCTEENWRCVSYYCIGGVNKPKSAAFQGRSGA
jgi:hypothetical protein